MLLEDNYLAHHGIQGQQWGVKHGPPYPIQPGAAVRIKKGTKLSRISPRDEADSSGHAYVTYNKEDMERYKGFFGYIIKKNTLIDKKSKVLIHDMEAAEDLRSPSQKERIATFIEMYKDDSTLAISLAKYHKHGESGTHAWLPQFVYNIQYSNLQDEKLLTIGYKTFVKSIGGNESIRSEYFKRLQKKGYNFLRDDQDSGNNGIEPSIIIDRKKSIKYNGNRELTNKEIATNLKKYGWRVDKKRRHREWTS